MKPGDLVCLKSGSPPLTVVHAHDVDGEKIIHFAWFCDADEFHRDALSMACLEPFEFEAENNPIAYAG